MTGFADQRERASGLNAIVYDVVTKPFSVADIRTAVAAALAARKSGLASHQLVIAGLDPAIHPSKDSREDGGYASQARVWHSRRDDESAPKPALNNPSAAARYNRVRSAGAADRRGGGGVLPESGAPAAHRSRRESSPSDRRRIHARAAAAPTDRFDCRRSAVCRRDCPGRRPCAFALLHRLSEALGTLA